METIHEEYEVGCKGMKVIGQEDCDAINLKGDGNLVVITFRKEGQIVSQIRLGRDFAETLRRGLEMGLRNSATECVEANGQKYYGRIARSSK